MRLMKLSTLCAAVMVVTTCSGDEGGRSQRLLSGKNLIDALQQRRSLNASGQGLRRVVTDLQGNTGIAICLDRRINPSSLVDVTTQYVTTKTIMESLARTQSEVGVSFADQYVLIGPVRAVGRLRTLTELRRQDVQKLRNTMAAERFRTLVETRNVSWPDLTEPRQLLVDAAKQAGVEIRNAEVVPHDLWAAADLPAVVFADLATMVLNQFDLTFEVSAAGVMTIIPVPEVVVIERRHRIPSKSKDEVLARWKAAVPDLDHMLKGLTATVFATVETHERLEELIGGNARTVVAASGLKSRLFTLKVQQAPFGILIEKLRKQGVSIRVEGRSGPELTEALQKTAAFDLTKSPSAEFFPKIFEGSGAKVTVTDDEVILMYP